MEHKDIALIARDVKQELAKQYPKCKWAVRIQCYSGGQSLKVALLSAPFPAFARDTDCNGNLVDGYAQLNQYQFQRPNDELLNNGAYLTKEAWNCMANAFRIASRDNWDKSDHQTDYYNVNYYLDLEIGRWNNPFVLTS